MRRKAVKCSRGKLETDRCYFRENVRPELMPSVVGSIRREMRNHSAMVQNRLNGKLDKLSDRQDGPLRIGSHSNVVIMDGRELPKFVLDILSLGPRHHVRDNFNEVHFLADVDKLERELSYARITLRVRNFGKMRCPRNSMQKRYVKAQWIEESKKCMIT